MSFAFGVLALCGVNVGNLFRMIQYCCEKHNKRYIICTIQKKIVILPKI